MYVRETTKTRKIRRVRFDESTEAALRQWKAVQSEDRPAFGPAWRPDGGLGIETSWIVTEPSGHVVHPDTLLRRWKVLVAAGVTPIGSTVPDTPTPSWHSRQAFGLDIVSRQLGHASIATTANIYTHDNDLAAADAATTLGRALGLASSASRGNPGETRALTAASGFPGS